MMTPNGPPTPKGVGGPSTPLVSRGSEDGWDPEIPTMGLHSAERGSGPGAHGIGGEACWDVKGRKGPSPIHQEQANTPLPTLSEEGSPPLGGMGSRGKDGARMA